jgi:hypothetical protein
MRPIAPSVVAAALAALVVAAAAPAQTQSGSSGRYVEVQGAAVHGFAGNTEIAYQWYADPNQAEAEAVKMRQLLGTGDVPIYDKVEVRPETRKVFTPRPREPQPPPPAPPTPPRPGARNESAPNPSFAGRFRDVRGRIYLLTGTGNIYSQGELVGRWSMSGEVMRMDFTKRKPSGMLTLVQ